jgi:hypothetical protein
MKKLVVSTAIVMIMIAPASAHKMGPSWRSPDSSDPPPWWLPQSPVADCHLVKERVATRRGHAVYQTRQVCG